MRILVRKDELACRNSWGSDLWSSATGEQPEAAPPPDTSTQLPFSMDRRDDEVTSVVHRDAPVRARQDVVERDDIMVVEASLVPELREPGDDAGNAAAHADQEHRARILARGGNHSAIQDARERMLARRSPLAGLDPIPSTRDQRDDDPADAVASDPESDPTEPVHAETADTAAFDRTSTPDDAPIRPLAPRLYGEQGRLRRSQSAHAEGSSSAPDDEDRYNSVPAIDPTIDLPLRNAEAAADTTTSDEPGETQDAPGTGGQVTVYDAVLERARAIRTAAGKESLTPPTPESVRAEEIAREEKRARRRITTVPPAQVTTATSTVAPEPVSPPVMAAPDPVMSPAASEPRQSALAAQDSPRPRPEAGRSRQMGNTGPGRPQAESRSQRMGIAIGAIKQDPPARPQAATPTPRTPNLDASFVRSVDFHRAPLEPSPVHEDGERAPAPFEVHDDTVMAIDDQAVAVDADLDLDPAFSDRDADDYLPLEEPLAAARRGPFGRFRNPWRKDREAIRERQIMANVRGALAESDEVWDDPFADLPDEDQPAHEVEEAPVSGRELGQGHPTQDDVVAFDNVPSARSPLGAPQRSQPETVMPEAPRPSRPATPSRSHGLYRPVHEDAYREQAVDPAPERDRRPGPAAPAATTRNDRLDRGNGATVLRVRADAGDTFADDAWSSPEADPTVRQPLRRSTGTPVRDAFRPLDSPPEELDDDESDLPDLGLQLETVEPLVTPVPASPWSFTPVDVVSSEGMDDYRSRLFGASSAPRRPTPERQPGDDVVLGVPPRAELMADGDRSPLPPRDSPLRSANYRAPEPRRPQGDAPREPAARPVRQDQGQPFHAQGVAAHSLPYRDDARTTVIDAPDPAMFDIRDLLSGDDDLLDPGVSIAPDVPRACRTCRDFRPSESGERGFCANNWAFTHRQMVNADDLPCHSTIGCWWLPSDRIWMPEERTESETHRVEALLPDLRRQRSG